MANINKIDKVSYRNWYDVFVSARSSLIPTGTSIVLRSDGTRKRCSKVELNRYFGLFKAFVKIDAVSNLTCFLKVF